MKKKLYLSSLLLICLSLCSLGVRAQAPVITTDPRDTTVCTGSTTRFYTQATGAGVTYMWLESTDGGATWDTAHNGAVYAGATTDTLRVVTSLTLDGYMYKGVAVNTSGEDTSLAATLNVDDAPVAGVIAGAANLCVGSTITLSNAAPGGVWSHTNNVADTFNVTSLVVEGLAPGIDTIKYTVSNTCGLAVATATIRVDAPGVSPITGPTATCVGNVITLMNASTGGTGVWSSSNTAVGTISGTIGSASFTAISAGTTTVAYTFTNACGTYTATLSVNVQSPLTVPTISGTDSVCVGSWTTLTGAPSGGIWISSSSAAVVDMSGNVTGISAGTAVISYLMSNACGAVVATDTVTVFAPAAAITGASDSVGIGSTLTLSNATADGTWSSADMTIATIGSTGIVTGLDTGITTISYTVTNICGTSVATYTLNVGPAPSAGTLSGIDPDTVCVGGTKTFTSTVTGGVWSMVNPRATVTAAGVVSGVTYGMDTLVYTVSNAFGTTQARKRVLVNWAHVDSVKGPNVVAIGGAYDIIGYPAGGTWSISTAGGDSMIALINASSAGHIVVVKRGLVTFTYTIANSCGTDTAMITLGVPPLNGVDNITDEGFMSIYPNPATEMISLNLETAVSQDATVTITNMIGQKVKELSVKTNSTTHISLDQPAGIYFVTAKTATGTYTAKVTIAK